MKKGILSAIVAAALLIPALLSGCSNSTTNEEEIEMTSDVVIPPIDTILPAEMETATFALG